MADTLCNFTATDAEPPIVDCLAVADIDEAAALPPCDLPILVLRPVENAYLGTQRARLEAAAHHGWVLTLASTTAADDVARIANAKSERVNVQIMINTGLNRAGIDPADFDDLVKKIQSLPQLRLVGVSTHFASADEPTNPLNAEQLARFLRVTQSICADRSHQSPASQRRQFRWHLLPARIASGHGSPRHQHLWNRPHLPAQHGTPSAAGDALDRPADRDS